MPKNNAPTTTGHQALGLDFATTVLGFLPREREGGIPVYKINAMVDELCVPGDNYFKSVATCLTFGSENQLRGRVFDDVIWSSGRKALLQLQLVFAQDRENLYYDFSRLNVYDEIASAIMPYVLFPKFEAESLQRGLQRITKSLLFRCTPKVPLSNAKLIETAEVASPVLTLVFLFTTLRGSPLLLAKHPDLLEVAAWDFRRMFQMPRQQILDSPLLTQTLSQTRKSLDSLLCYSGSIDILCPADGPNADLQSHAAIARSVLTLRKLYRQIDEFMKQGPQIGENRLFPYKVLKQAGLYRAFRCGHPPPLELQALFFSLEHPELFSPDQRLAMTTMKRPSSSLSAFVSSIKETIQGLELFSLKSKSFRLLEVLQGDPNDDTRNAVKYSRPLTPSSLQILRRGFALSPDRVGGQELRALFSATVSSIEDELIVCMLSRDLVSSPIFLSSLRQRLPEGLRLLAAGEVPKEDTPLADLFSKLFLLALDPLARQSLRPLVRWAFEDLLSRPSGPRPLMTVPKATSLLMSVALRFDLHREPDVFRRLQRSMTLTSFNFNMWHAMTKGMTSLDCEHTRMIGDSLLGSFTSFVATLRTVLFLMSSNVENPSAADLNELIISSPSYDELSRSPAELNALFKSGERHRVCLEGLNGLLFITRNQLFDGIARNLDETARPMLNASEFVRCPLGTEAVAVAVDLLRLVQTWLGWYSRFSSSVIRNSLRLVRSRLPQLSRAEAKKMKDAARKSHGEHKLFLQKMKSSILPSVRNLKKAVDVQLALRDRQLVSVY